MTFCLWPSGRSRLTIHSFPASMLGCYQGQVTMWEEFLSTLIIIADWRQPLPRSQAPIDLLKSETLAVPRSSPFSVSFPFFSSFFFFPALSSRPVFSVCCLSSFQVIITDGLLPCYTSTDFFCFRLTPASQLLSVVSHFRFFHLRPLSFFVSFLSSLPTPALLAFFVVAMNCTSMDLCTLIHFTVLAPFIAAPRLALRKDSRDMKV